MPGSGHDTVLGWGRSRVPEVARLPEQLLPLSNVHQPAFQSQEGWGFIMPSDRRSGPPADLTVGPGSQMSFSYHIFPERTYGGFKQIPLMHLDGRVRIHEWPSAHYGLTEFQPQDCAWDNTWPGLGSSVAQNACLVCTMLCMQLLGYKLAITAYSCKPST